MKIQITACGKLKDKDIKNLIDEYIKRVPWGMKIIEVEASNKSSNPETIKLEEERLLLSKIPTGHYKIALDETGSMLSSVEFAKLIEKTATNHTSNISFIIGGSAGLSENARKSADFVISLGKFTYPHMLARLLLVEQIYRSFTILEGKSYHK